MGRTGLVVFVLCCLTAVSGVAAQPARLSPPVITPLGGHFDINSEVVVTIRADSGCRVVYTLDDTLPSAGRGITGDGNLVSFVLPMGDVTVLAIATKPGFAHSVTSKAVFTRSAECSIKNAQPGAEQRDWDLRLSNTKMFRHKKD